MSNATDTDIVVFRHGDHGMQPDELAAAIRTELPEYTVTVARTPQEEYALLQEATIAVGREIDMEAVAESDTLDLFACTFAGTDHLDVKQLTAQDVKVTNASGVHGPNIAEHVLGHILVFARRLHEGWKRQQRREWRHYQAGELTGKTVTIVGLGAIGETIVDRLAGFDVDTIGVRYSPEKGGPTDEVIGFDDDALHTALAKTDYLVLACPLTDTTRGLIGRDELKTLPPTAVLVNVARGPVVDTDALIAELRAEKLRGAALDVTDPEPLPEDHPLWNFGNVLITPHNAGHTPEYYPRLADIVAENANRLATDGNTASLVNQVR